jgi:cytochrome c oxidase subunit 4
MAHAAHDHHQTDGHGDDHGHAHGAGHANTHSHGHGHTIIPMRTLVVVLSLLLFFTLLTVAAANAEQFFATAFQITIPQWVNVAVALSIAAVKSIIVAAYFMQLRYDNPLNTMIAVFTVLVFTFFLGFIMVDLGSRNALYQYKADQQIEGGIGGFAQAGGVQVPSGTSVAQFARDRADQTISSMLAEGKKLPKHLAMRLAIVVTEKQAAHQEAPAAWVAYLDKHPEVRAYAHAGHHGGDKGHAHHGPSTGNAARVRTGITLPELQPAGGADKHGKDEKKPDDHGDTGAKGTH